MSKKWQSKILLNLQPKVHSIYNGGIVCLSASQLAFYSSKVFNANIMLISKNNILHT